MVFIGMGGDNNIQFRHTDGFQRRRYIIAVGGVADVNEHGFPVALGVIRDVDAPTYDEAVNAQIEEVKGKKAYHNFAELLETNDIWEVK